MIGLDLSIQRLALRQLDERNDLPRIAPPQQAPVVQVFADGEDLLGDCQPGCGIVPPADHVVAHVQDTSDRGAIPEPSRHVDRGSA